jgi:hypothetical protein
MVASLSALDRSVRCATGVLVVASLCACGGGGAPVGTQDPQPARPVTQSDLEIAQLLYTDSARTPPEFYSEPAPSSAYTATFHIKNTDLAPPANPSDPAFELCTDDWNQALDWSETVAQARPVYSDLTETDTTEHYYQFVRTPRSTSLGTDQMRVYRCTFLDRVGADVARITGAAGHINKRPLTGADVKWTLEYLWRFSIYNNLDNVVLRSAAVSDAASPAHELTLAQLVHGAGANGCDRVRVFAWSYRADAASGALLGEQRDLWTFDARRDSSTVQLCNP